MILARRRVDLQNGNQRGVVDTFFRVGDFDTARKGTATPGRRSAGGSARETPEPFYGMTHFTNRTTISSFDAPLYPCLEQTASKSSEGWAFYRSYAPSPGAPNNR